MEIGYAEALSGLPSADSSICPRVSISAPNRLATSNWDLLIALGATMKDLESLRANLLALTGAKDVLFAPSCRAAIAQILSALPEREVVIPAYTCPVVKTAVQIAGKAILYADIGTGGLNSTSAEFASYARAGRVLIPTHLFGIPTDVEEICRISKQHGCVTIEDAAAAMGGFKSGKALGTFADFGIYSFERSKRFPGFRGAAILINNEDLANLDKLRSPVVQTRYAFPARDILHAIMYNIATIPALYGRIILPRLLRKHQLAARERQIRVLLNPVQSPFYNRQFHAYQARLINYLLKQLPTTRKHIAALADIYRKVLADSGVIVFAGKECDDGALLRFPIAIPGTTRAAVLRAALQRGVYLETNYERVLSDDEKSVPKALWAARNVVLLPLYPSLSLPEAKHLAHVVLEIQRELSHHREIEISTS